MKKRLLRIARLALVAISWQYAIIWKEVLGKEWKAYGRLLDSIQD